MVAGMSLLVGLGLGYVFLFGDKTANHQDAVVQSSEPKVEQKSEPPLNPPSTYSVSKSTGNVTHVPLADILQPTVNRNEIASVTLLAIHRKKILLPLNLPSILGYPFADKQETAVNPVPASNEDIVNSWPPVTSASVPSNHWTLGSEFAPLYSDRSIATDELSSDQMAGMNNSEDGLLAYAGGINLAYKTSKRLSIQTGLYYSRYGQVKDRVESVNVYPAEQFDGLEEPAKAISIFNSTGIIAAEIPQQDGYNRAIYNTVEGEYLMMITNDNFISNPLFTQSEPTDIIALQYFDYIEVPLHIRYKFLDRRLDCSLSGGIVTNFLVGNKVKLLQDGNKTTLGKTEGITNINYVGSIGLGLDYPVSTVFSVRLEPRFRYYLNPIYETQMMSVRPYSLGIFAGITYTF
jgi:hypothetical protein